MKAVTFRELHHSKQLDRGRVKHCKMPAMITRTDKITLKSSQKLTTREDNPSIAPSVVNRTVNIFYSKQPLLQKSPNKVSGNSLQAIESHLT